MNSISPQMLRLAAGNVTLLKTADAAEGQEAGGAPLLKRLLRMAVRWRWMLIWGVAAGAVLGLLVTLLATRQYASTARLQISRDTAQVVNVGAISRDVSIGDQEFYQTQYGLLRARALSERVARDLGVVDDPAFFRTFGKSAAFTGYPGVAGQPKRNEIAGEILLNHVVVAPVNGSSLVDIRATTPSPELSTKLAQTWGQDFIASTLERRLDASSYARQFLETRIEQLRERLEDSERKAVEYAAAQGIIELPTPGNGPKSPSNDSTQTRSLLTDDLTTLNAARASATADRIQAASRLAAADKDPDSSSDSLNYRAIGLLRNQRAEAAAEYARLAAHASPDDPAVKAVGAQVEAFDAAIQSERSRVRTALQQTYQAAFAREQALTQRVNGLKGSLADQRQRSIQYNIYQRDADTNRELYDALLQRYKEIGVAGAVENNNVAVVDAAKLPDRPSSPRLIVNLVLFMLLGAIIAAAVAALLDQIDNGVTDPGEFEEKVGVPLLGVAPKLKAEPPFEALKNPRSEFAEAHLMVEANLELAAAQGAPKSLAVLSTRPREGKSTTAVALAQTLARAGRKVVLVDANLRAPSVHTAFGLANDAGLSDLLSGDSDLKAVLQATERDGLSVITAGPQPPNPGDLLIGARLGRLVKELQERFSHVIVDGPSVMGLADALLVASAVEGVVYVVEARSTPARMVRTALGRLDAAHVAGGVLAMFQARRAGVDLGRRLGGVPLHGYGGG
jgi:capsular exopolysaccharide synthesis family protein